jgi:hypothetical protein
MEGTIRMGNKTGQVTVDNNNNDVLVLLSVFKNSLITLGIPVDNIDFTNVKEVIQVLQENDFISDEDRKRLLSHT